MKYQNWINKISFVCAALLFVSCVFAQSEDRTYKDKGFSCKYQIKYGMLHGHYESFYKNGTKKSEGTFEYNHRIGEWSVWDSTGKLRVKRIYSNPLEYKQVIPVVSPDGPIPMLNKPLYTLQRDSLGEWKYYFLHERMCAYRQRNFKCFYTREKQLFFDCKTLFNILYTNAKKKNCTVYGTNKHDEDDTYSVGKLDIATIDTSKIKLVGFRVKSDFIFDNTRFLSQDIPLFITPLVVTKVSPTDTFDLFNVYVPHVRKYLAQVKLTYPDLPSYLQNLDDVFFFECFSTDKWRASGVFDGIHDTSVRTPKSSANKFQLGEVETENDLWLHFNK